MLKTKCQLAFIRRQSQWFEVNAQISKSIAARSCQILVYRQSGRQLYNNAGSFSKIDKVCKTLPEAFSFQSLRGVSVHYSRNARANSDALTKHTSALDVKVDVTEKQTKLDQDSSHPHVNLSWRQLLGYYLKLSKIRLTGLVVLTAMAGYNLAPGEFSAVPFLFASLGTMLCSCSANTINQWLEVPFDSQMSRTKNRVLVRGLISPLHAISFGMVTGASGLAILLTQVNGLTALLGATNLILYTSVYTPLKRISILNTWVGSLVGALPPLMGWAACAGTLDPGALILGGILYSWQFPHFNALSWNLRADYSRAGYRMMSVINPSLCRKVALRHCVSLVALSTLLPVCDVTTWWLTADSLPLNLWFTWLAWKFNKESDNKSARELFRFSLLHLPLLMFLVLFHKKPQNTSEARTLRNIFVPI